MAKKISQSQVQGTKGFQGLDDEIKSIHSSIDTNERDISKMKTDIADNKSAISTVEGQVAGVINTTIPSLDSRIRTNKEATVSLDKRTTDLESLMVDGITKKSIVFFVGMIKHPEGHKVSTYVPLKGRLNKFYVVLGTRASVQDLSMALKNESGDVLCEIMISAGNVYTDGVLESVPISYEPLHLVLYGEVALGNISVVFDIIPDALDTSGVQ